MLIKRYMVSTKNLSAILQKIREGTAPSIFNVEHLASLGFSSSNDRAIVPLLKDLGFLSEQGVPTQRYRDYRDGSRSRRVLGKALLDAYEDLFHINENITEKDRQAVQGKFVSSHNLGQRAAESAALTFFALLKHADISGAREENAGSVGAPTVPVEKPPETVQGGVNNGVTPTHAAFPSLRYNIEVHLPATHDVAVYNAIFKALKDHLA